MRFLVKAAVDGIWGQGQSSRSSARCSQPGSWNDASRCLFLAQLPLTGIARLGLAHGAGWICVGDRSRLETLPSQTDPLEKRVRRISGAAEQFGEHPRPDLHEALYVLRMDKV